MTRKEALKALAKRADDRNLCIPDMDIFPGKRPWMFTEDSNRAALQEIKDALGVGNIPEGYENKTAGNVLTLRFNDDEFEAIGRELQPFLARGGKEARKRWEYLDKSLNICRLLRKTP